jgi:Ran GTPase-activating protein (RanGAP) involved in mRNA processing and transport
MNFQIVNDDVYISNQTRDTPVQINIGQNGIYFDAYKRNITATMLIGIINKLGNIKIEGVDLENNRLKDNKTTAKLLRKFFFQNLIYAHTINLSNNQLGSLVAKVFIEVLAKLEKLEFLSLRNNNFSSEDKKRIREACPNTKIDF